MIVAAHRQSRPWIGQTVASPQTQPPPYVSDCYLCPGNARVSGAANPAYTDVYVFDNDHPCVGPNAPAELTQPPQRAAVSGLSDDEAASLARALKDVVVCYDNLWREPFPYIMPLHQAPTDGENYDEFHFFVGFLPPLSRPNTLKYLAGPDIGGGNFLSDTSPEDKAAELRAQSTIHYREQEPKTENR